MSHHSESIQLCALDELNDEIDDNVMVEVSFDWTPGTPQSGNFGPPEDYDPGSGEEFYIVDKGGIAVPDEKIIAWLEENWDRPDYAAERADYAYEDYRERMRERQDD